MWIKNKDVTPILLLDPTWTFEAGLRERLGGLRDEPFHATDESEGVHITTNLVAPISHQFILCRLGVNLLGGLDMLEFSPI